MDGGLHISTMRAAMRLEESYWMFKHHHPLEASERILYCLRNTRRQRRRLHERCEQHTSLFASEATSSLFDTGPLTPWSEGY